jgi:cytochrome b
MLGQPSVNQVRVWSPSLRLLKWLFAASMVGAFVTHEASSRLGPITVHEWLGYLALGAAALRVLMGVVGTGVWRFDDFVRSPRATWAYAQAVWARREPRHLGHNPLGGWMIVALLVDALVCGFSGWLYTTDRFWGVAWVGDLHEVSGDLLLPLVALHVGGVVLTSRRHHENLLAAMIHGNKAPLQVENKK